MARTKQTARGAKSNQPDRQSGMEAAVVEPTVAEQGEAPEEVVDVEEAAKKAEEEGAKQGEAVRPEDQVTADQGTTDPAPQPGTSTAPTAPASVSADAEIRLYMEKSQGFTKTWFENVIEKKEQAYRDLIASLVSQVEEQSKIRDLKVDLAGFSGQPVENVLDSISDTSGRYVDQVSRSSVEITKEEEEIAKRRFPQTKPDSPEQTALDEYYEAATDLCRSQKRYMVKLENLSLALGSSDKLLQIINHVQLPAVQVTVTTKEQEKKQAGLSGQEMVINAHLPESEGWKTGRATNERLMAAWLYFILYRQVTGTSAGQDRCADRFSCSHTQFKRLLTGKWQEGGRRKGDTTTTGVAQKRKSERLQTLKKQETEGVTVTSTKAKRQRKAPKVITVAAEDDDDNEDDE